MDDKKIMTEDDLSSAVSESELDFEDYTVTTPVPSAATSLNNIKSGSKLDKLLSNIKSFLLNTVTKDKIVQSTNITQNGYLMDGKVVSDKFTVINDALTASSKIPITTNISGITINTNYSYYIKKSGFCFFQIAFTVPDTAQHEIGRVLPISNFGNYIYYYSKNSSEARIEAGGNVRLTGSIAGIETFVNGCYPCA